MMGRVGHAITVIIMVMVMLPLAAQAGADESVARAIEASSARYVGIPYLLDPLGEGPAGVIDRDPLVRFDRFDCQTFVETVVAQARSDTQERFLAELAALRYRNAQVDFAARNHFPDADWIPNNVARGVLVELNAEVAGAHTLAQARTLITRRAWLLNLAHNPAQARNSYLRSSPDAQAALRAMAAAATDEEAVIRYVPKDALRDPAVLVRIPSGAIVFIVRPHSNPDQGRTGSLQNISHLGFAIRQAERLLFRHASSSRAYAVVDEPLAEYLRRLSRSRSFAGIAVYGVR
jgi:hypothetical protein